MIENKYIAFILLLLAIITPLSAQINVLCVGNSITWGDGTPSPGGESSYPAKLGMLLGGNYYVENRGDPGHTILYWPPVAYMKGGQFRYSIEEGIPWDIIIICLGTNDSHFGIWGDNEDFVDDYNSLINAYISNNIAKFPDRDEPVFILVFPPPVFDESKGHNNDVVHDEIIPKVKQLAQDLGYTTADFYSALAGKPEMFADGIHPNEEGAQIMANVAHEAIQKTLAVAGPAPDIPTGLKTIPRLDYIDLEWHPNLEPDIFKYRVYRSESEFGYQLYLGEVLAPDTTFSDTYNIVKDHIYYYAIDAMDLSGITSGRSHSVPGKTIDLTPPSPPSDLFGSLEADSIKLDWKPNTEIDLSRYYIYRNTDQNELQNSNSIIATIYPPLSSYNDINYISAETQFYGIKAQDVSGNLSTISNIIEITARSRPLSSDTTVTAYEDQKRIFSSADFPFNDADDDVLEHLVFINSDKWEYFLYDNDSIDGSFICEELSKLSFQALANEHGPEYTYFKYKVIDSFGSTSLDTNTMVINVSPVNDEPTLDPLDDLHLIEDTHDISIQVSGISTGQIDEIQNLSIEIIPPDTALFNPGRIQYTSPDSNGIITIDPKENVSGEQLVTVRIWDDGGTENNGVNYTDESFHLYIAPRNDPPVIDLKPITIIEDIDTSITITGIQAGPWESNQNISISVKSNNTDILPDPILTYFSPDNFATLTFSTIPNVNGTTALTLSMSDDGGTELGGIDSEAYTIPVEILAINDKPSGFDIITPSYDSTLVITKYNFNDSFTINWEESKDIENDAITYDIIFEKGLSELSRYGLSETSYDFTLKDILSVTDTVNITTDSYTVSASDGELETIAFNSGLKLAIDGRAFAPAELNLDQNYPNPFNHSTKIGFDLPKKSAITLSIFDLLGEEIVRLVDNKTYLRGYNIVTWNGLDENYQHVSAGVYIVQIKMQNEVRHKKLLLLK